MSRDDIKIDGKKEAAALLAGLDSEHRNRLLNEIRKKDPALAAHLEKGLYSFNQVLKLESLDLQKVLHGLPPRIIAMSLRGLDAELKKALYAKMSVRQSQLLEDELQTLGPQKLSDVKQAQDKIAAHAGQLHEQGVIKLI